MLVEDVRIKFNLFLKFKHGQFSFYAVCRKYVRILFDDCKVIAIFIKISSVRHKSREARTLRFRPKNAKFSAESVM